MTTNPHRFRKTGPRSYFATVADTGTELGTVDRVSPDHVKLHPKWRATPVGEMDAIGSHYYSRDAAAHALADHAGLPQDYRTAQIDTGADAAPANPPALTTVARVNDVADLAVAQTFYANGWDRLNPGQSYRGRDTTAGGWDPLSMEGPHRSTWHLTGYRLVGQTDTRAVYVWRFAVNGTSDTRYCAAVVDVSRDPASIVVTHVYDYQPPSEQTRAGAEEKAADVLAELTPEEVAEPGGIVEEHEKAGHHDPDLCDAGLHLTGSCGHPREHPIHDAPSCGCGGEHWTCTGGEDNDQEAADGPAPDLYGPWRPATPEEVSAFYRGQRAPGTAGLRIVGDHHETRDVLPADADDDTPRDWTVTFTQTITRRVNVTRPAGPVDWPDADAQAAHLLDLACARIDDATVVSITGRLDVAEPVKPVAGHQCEPWQMDDSAQGGRYCRACGAHEAGPTPGSFHDPRVECCQRDAADCDCPEPRRCERCRGRFTEDDAGADLDAGLCPSCSARNADRVTV